MEKCKSCKGEVNGADGTAKDVKVELHTKYQSIRRLGSRSNGNAKEKSGAAEENREYCSFCILTANFDKLPKAEFLSEKCVPYTVGKLWKSAFQRR